MIYIAVIVLTVLVMILAVKLLIMRNSVKYIAEQLKEKTGSDTNTLISVSSNDKYIRNLALRLNEQLRDIREKRHRYEQGDAELKTAVTNVSHDIRTPLTAVFGYLDLLEREELSENARKYTGIITERCEAMKILTEELFRYSVTLKTEEQEEKEEVDVNAVLEESLIGFYGTLTGRGIEPEINICSDKVIRFVNRANLSRVFSNLLSNAVKYSDGDLSISLENDGTVIFSNRAPELDGVQVEKLFGRFYTLESARTSTGLGLSIARSFTEQMGGTLNAEFSDGRLFVKMKI